MPYNKGDFTQQGINGDVSALVRLNEKRVMKVVLSSDDESSNVDVTGTVYDYLNGETYPLGGSTPTGTITITENGEGIDVAQYRYADVSVSGGGGITLNYCEITLVNNSAADLDCPVTVINNGGIEGRINVTANSSLTVISPYHNLEDGTFLDIYTDDYSNFALSSAVNCEVNSDFGNLAPIDNTTNSSCTVTFTGLSQ